MTLCDLAEERRLLRQLALRLDAGEYEMVITAEGCEIDWVSADGRWARVTLEIAMLPKARREALTVIHRRLGRGWLTISCQLSHPEDPALVSAAAQLGDRMLAR